MTFRHLPNRAVVSLTGPDTIALLERIVTHNTADWTTGQARYGGLLTPQGKVIVDYIALRTDDGVLLDAAKNHTDDLAKRLKMFRLRSDVQIERRDDLGVLIASDDVAGSFPDPRNRDMPRRAFGPPNDYAPADTYETARIEHGVPEQGADFGAAEVFPAEINMDLHGGVDLKKGCFVGQEVVSRMHRRGSIRKRTLVLYGTGIKPASDLISSTPLGTVTSTSLGTALARVRLDRLAKAGALSVDDKPVTVKKTDWLQGEMAAFRSDD